MDETFETVIGVQVGSYPEVANVPITVKADIIYAFALPGYQGAPRIGKEKTPKRVVLLRTEQLYPTHRMGNLSALISHQD